MTTLLYKWVLSDLSKPPIPPSQPSLAQDLISASAERPNGHHRMIATSASAHVDRHPGVPAQELGDGLGGEGVVWRAFPCAFGAGLGGDEHQRID